jgi:transposase
MDRAEAEAIFDAGRDVCVQFIVDLPSQVGELGERLRRLEERARRDSRTSSKPPSSDPPKTWQQRRAEARAKAKELFRKEGERRKPGGQSGHPGAGRELEPEDRVDEIVDHYPKACRGSGREFSADDRQPSSRFGRRQVAELPPISVTLVEHRTHRLSCRRCGTKTTAEMPGAIGDSASGPNLQAALVTLTARNRISRRGISELASSTERSPTAPQAPAANARRTRPLRSRHVQTAKPLTVRLSTRLPHRTQPRRSLPRAHLTPGTRD